MTTVPRWVLTLFRAASLFTLLAVIGGSLVAATESGFECSTWPGCDTDVLLPGGPVNALLYRNPWIEMSHRASAVLAGPLALAAALAVARRHTLGTLVRILPWAAVAGAIVAGYVGRGIVLGTAFPTWVIAADLGSALIALAAMTTATIALERTSAPAAPGAAAGLAWGALAVLFALHIAGIYAAGPGSYTRVMSWPVWHLVAADVHGSHVAQILRFVLLAVAVALIALAVRASGTTPLTRERATVSTFAVLCLAFGAIIAATGTDTLGVPFSLAAVGAWTSLILLAARLTWPPVEPAPSPGMTSTPPASDTLTPSRP